MSDIIISVLESESVPNWVGYIIFAIVIIGILVIFALAIVGMYKFANSVNKESKVLDLSNDNQKLARENEKLKNKDKQMLLVTQYISNTFLEAYEEIRTLNYQTIVNLKELKSELDKEIDNYNSNLNKNNKYENPSTILSTYDDKHEEIRKEFILHFEEIISNLIHAGSYEVAMTNRTRISLWVVSYTDSDGNELDCPTHLEMFYASTHFKNTKNKTIQLPINQSIAGRAYRTKKIQWSLDLNNDPDWLKTNSTQYSAIFAAPLDHTGVLTIDFYDIPDSNQQAVAEQFATFFNYAFGLRSIILELLLLHNNKL